MVEHLKKAQTFLKEKALDCIFVINMRNIRYISGFTGSSAVLLVFPDKAVLFTDFRYMQQASEQAKCCEIVEHGSNVYKDINKTLYEVKKIGYESGYVTVSAFKKMSEQIENKDWIEISLDTLRMVKDEKEIANIVKAVEIADKSLQKLLPEIKIGMTEQEIAAILEFYMKQHGASGTSFSTIVASGPRSALPHGMPTDRKLSSGDFLLMDFGAVYDGYCSDMTRTFVMGKADDKQKKIYNTVLKAQMAALSGLKPGMTGAQGDALARDVIKDAGYGENFGHGTGHSLGLAIHESPRLSPANHSVIEPGMLMTVEPGIYIADWGGVRIEDLLLVKDDGVEILTQSGKKLLEL